MLQPSLYTVLFVKPQWLKNVSTEKKSLIWQIGYTILINLKCSIESSLVSQIHTFLLKVIVMKHETYFPLIWGRYRFEIPG